MGKFKRIDTSIDGVCIIEPTVFGDDRGFFMETYEKNDFGEYMIMLMQKFSAKDIEEQAKKFLKNEIKNKNV